jgi:radical SAM protein with 4Fe4S-binding SPASM domain
MILPLKSFLRTAGTVNVRITGRRLFNLIRIYSSMYLSRILKRQIVWGYPPVLMVEPTNICNLKCPMCPSGNGEMKRSTGQLDLPSFRKVMDDIGDYLMQVQLWNQGEPFINKNFLEFVAYAKSKGVMTQTSTNGHFIKTDAQAEALVRSGLDVLIFSLDGTNAESYAKYRVGGNFNLVLEALERIARVKRDLGSRTPMVELQFLVFKHNQDEIEKIIGISKRFDLDRLSFKTAQVYSKEQAETFLPEDSRFNRYDRKGGAYKLKGNIPNWCKRLWLNPAVNWDGRISPCCFDKDADYAFGNLFENENAFSDIWTNDLYKKFRRQIMTDRKSVEMCTNCTEGLPEPYTRIIETRDT